ncbi:MAG: dihydroneopterin aldolase family protein [Halanaeroarchaeum sp.]
MPTDAETAAFETGIKFGSLYHQFAGTPVSEGSAESLARAMEEAIENQPHAESVTVEVDDAAIAADADDHGYVELTGEYLTVEVVVAYEGLRATARMAVDEGYPLMRLVSIEEP